MTEMDSFHTTIIPDPPPEKQPHPILVHLPDIIAVAIISSSLILPSEILHHHYLDQAKYIHDSQSSLLLIKTAMVSQLPALIITSFACYARLTKNKSLTNSDQIFP